VSDDARCYYCNLPFRDENDLRPYGPNGAVVCYKCAMATPEREAAALQCLRAAVDDAFDQARASGGIVVIGAGAPHIVRRVMG
jgi:hypothetical protein